jgi:hypothetical protein
MPHVQAGITTLFALEGLKMIALDFKQMIADEDRQLTLSHRAVTGMNSGVLLMKFSFGIIQISSKMLWIIKEPNSFNDAQVSILDTSLQEITMTILLSRC